MRLFILVLIGIMVCAVGSSAVAASFCEQSYTILGKTAGDTAWLYFDEYVSNECQESHLYAVLLTPDRHVILQGYVGDDSIGAAWGVLPFMGLPTEQPIHLFDSAGIFRLPSGGQFSVPTDPDFPLRWQNVDYSLNSWERQMTYPTKEFPIFEGVKAEQLYAHRALYKNYSIKEALYYPESSYLVIVTDQPLKQVGMDTMHGLLIYRIAKSGSN